ncbi:hypothetical protein [Streptomyces hydrogenans]|uniref:hypothetical protein n=1 Tax=Streptomyces hydrogenans TaxID=1873719 RepID=UPI003821B40E
MRVAAKFVNRVGNGLFDAASALHFTLVVGLPAVQVGAALTIVATVDQIAAAVGGAAWGALGARVGGERPAVFRAKLRTFVDLDVILGTVGAGPALAAGSGPAVAGGVLRDARRHRPLSGPLGRADPAAAGRCRRLTAAGRRARSRTPPRSPHAGNGRAGPAWSGQYDEPRSRR